MMGHRQFGWDDYLAIWRRRRFLIIVPAILGPVVLFCVSPWYCPPDMSPTRWS